MSTRILDLDLAEPLPAVIDMQGSDRLLLIFWSRGVPVGTQEIRTESRRIGRLQLSAAVGKALGETGETGSLDALPMPSDSACDFVSVVVCTCRRPTELIDCLKALLAQDYPRFEILVVDNDPQGSASGLVSRQYPAVRYCAEEQCGVRFARNRGVAEASGDIIAFIDDDCLPIPGWLRAVAGNFRQYPQLGCCTGPVLPAALDTPAQEWLELRGGFNRGFVRRVHTRDSGRQRWRAWPLQAWMFGSGGNMAFRRSVLQQIGPFDQVLPTAEDLDIFFRVLHAGFELAYEPAAAVRHRHVSTYPALRRRLYLWGWGYIAYLLKVACEQPDYRRRALAEIAAWFPYQLRERLWQSLRRHPDYPLGLILIEIAGGVAAIPSYLWRRTTDRRRPATSPLPAWK